MQLKKTVKKCNKCSLPQQQKGILLTNVPIITVADLSLGIFKKISNHDTTGLTAYDGSWMIGLGLLNNSKSSETNILWPIYLLLSFILLKKEIFALIIHWILGISSNMIITTVTFREAQGG